MTIPTDSGRIAAQRQGRYRCAKRSIAEEGKRLLSEDRPDIMVSDIAMPDDGIELIRAVKASADAEDLRIPVIAITAHRYRGDELLAAGFAELIEKPFDPIALCRVVLRHTQPAHA